MLGPRDQCRYLVESQEILVYVRGERKDTVSCDDPEYGGYDEVAEGTDHSHEELGFVVDVAPRLQGTEERLSLRDLRNDGLALSVLSIDFLGIRGAACFACGCDCGGHGFAVVHCLFDDKESEDE